MEYIIECSIIHTRQEMHRAIADSLSFPVWYGQNLDALYDLLTSISVPIHLVFHNWDSCSPVFQEFRTVLDDAEKENGLLSISYL